MILEKIINRVAKIIVWVVTLFLIMAINLVNLVYYNNKHFSFTMTVELKLIISAVFVVGTGIFIYLLNKIVKKEKEVKFLLVVILIAFFLRLIWVLLIKTPPVQDYLDIWKASLAFANGQKNFSQTNHYLYLYPYMIGFILYQGIVIKILGAKLIVFKFLNVIFSTLTVVMTEKITSKLFSKKAGLVAAILLAIYPPAIVINSILTNDILATLFFLIAFYMFLSKDLTWQRSLLIGMYLFLGNFLRPLASIIILSLFLYGLFIGMGKLKWSYLLTLSMIFISYGCLSFGFDQILLKNNISSQSFQTVNSEWKLAEGLNAKTNGRWSAEDYDYIEKGKTKSDINHRNKKLLTQRLKQKPTTFLKLFITKFSEMWADFDSNISWALKNTNTSPKVLQILCLIQKIVYMAIIFLTGAFILKGNLSDGVYLLLIVICGYILIHEGIEIQTRYRYFIMPFLTILAGAYFQNTSRGSFIESVEHK